MSVYKMKVLTSSAVFISAYATSRIDRIDTSRNCQRRTPKRKDFSQEENQNNYICLAKKRDRRIEKPWRDMK